MHIFLYGQQKAFNHEYRPAHRLIACDERHFHGIPGLACRPNRFCGYWAISVGSFGGVFVHDLCRFRHPLCSHKISVRGTWARAQLERCRSHAKVLCLQPVFRSELFSRTLDLCRAHRLFVDRRRKNGKIFKAHRIFHAVSFAVICHVRLFYRLRQSVEANSRTPRRAAYNHRLCGIFPDALACGRYREKLRCRYARQCLRRRDILCLHAAVLSHRPALGERLFCAEAPAHLADAQGRAAAGGFGLRALGAVDTGAPFSPPRSQGSRLFGG